MAESRPLMYVGLHGTNDPTRATMPFLLATGAGTAEIDTCVVLLGEAAMLAKPGMIDTIKGVGFPPLTELLQKVRDFNIPVYV
jgi:predicted peroxiredoxin